MRDKKRFISVILITSVMLFAGGCSKQDEPVSAEPTETVKEVDTEESLEPTPSTTALPEESMEGSEAPDNFEDEAVVEDETIVEDKTVTEDKTVVKEAETTKTETNGSVTSDSVTNGSTTTENVQPAQPSQPAQPAHPAHTHSCKEHTATKQVWVPNMVVVDDYETRVVGQIDDVFICDCGYTTTDAADIEEHIVSNVLANNAGHGGFGIQPGHSIVEQVKVGFHEEDKGHYEAQTYVDYYYCDCGAIK